MKRKVWFALLGLPWLMAAALVLWVWSIWDRLPALMAVHFNAQGIPNGWDTPAHMLSVLVPSLGCALVVFGGIAWMLSRQNKLPWFFVAAYNWAAVGILAITASIFRFALSPDSPQLPAMPLGVILLTEFYSWWFPLLRGR